MSTPTSGIFSSLFGLIGGSTEITAPASGPIDPFATDTISSSVADGEPQIFLNASFPVLTAPTTELSLIQWHALLSSATNALTDQLHLSDTQSMLLNSKLWAELGAWASAMLAKQKSIVDLSGKENKIYQAQLSNSLAYDTNIVKPYNTFLTNLGNIATPMYLLQEQYIAGDITTAEYNTAVNEWNANVGSLNAQLQSKYDTYLAGTIAYNTKIDATNVKITASNLLRLKNGITPPLPLLERIIPAPEPDPLPTLIPGPPPPTSTTVPDLIPTTPESPPSSGVSTVINVTPTTAEEQALLDSISQNLNNINSGPVAAYNTAMLSAQSQVSAMSDAIVAYQNGGSFLDYSIARDNYLTFANTFNVTLIPLAQAYILAVEAYNLTLPSINDQINNFNTIRVAAGQMLIPIQDDLPVPIMSLLLLTEDIPAGPPAPTENPFEDAQLPVLLPPAPNGSTTPTNPLAYSSKYFNTTFASGLLSLRDFSEILTSQNTYRQFLYFILAGGKTNLFPSNAYIAPHPEIKFDVKSDGAAISGVGLTSLILGLDSKALTNVISNSLFQSAGNVLDNKQIPPEVTGKAALFALSVLEKISLASALPALGLLGGAGDLDPAQLEGNPAVAGALALANLQALNAFLDSGALETELTGFLTDAGFSATEIAKVLPILTAAVTIGLIQTVISQLAVALGLPGLLAQVLGNLPGSNLQKQVTLAQAKQFGHILSNGTNVQNLKSDLFAELIKLDNIDRSIAQSQINKAINDTLANQSSLSNADNLRADLQRNLIAQGVNENTANALAQQALDFVQAEQQLPDLPTLLVKDDILKSNVLTSNRFSEIISNENLQTAVNQAFVQGEATKRDFRNALVTQLVQQGVDRANANLISTELLLSVQSDAIKNSFSIDRVNRDTLLKSLIITPDNPNAANIIAAVDATFALVPKTELEFREILTRQLETLNVDRLAAIELAKNAAIAQENNNPLRSVNASNFLTRDQLAAQLIANFSDVFNGNVNGRTVTNLASQLTLAIIGPVLAPEYQADQIRRTNSVLSRLGDAYIQSKNTHVVQTDREVAANFTDFIAPKTTDSFALITPVLTGMHLFLLFSGLMYEGMGRKPTNFKESIDIPI